MTSANFAKMFNSHRCIAATAMLLAVAGLASARGGVAKTGDIYPKLSPTQVVTNAVPVLALPLPLSAVRLTGGPLQHAQELDSAYLLQLEPDRMLFYLRKRAGLEPKAAKVTAVGMGKAASLPATSPDIIFRPSATCMPPRATRVSKNGRTTSCAS